MGMNPDAFWYEQRHDDNYDDYDPPWWNLRARWRWPPTPTG